MSNIDLGYLVDRDPTWLTNRYFPSKLGGFPAWLELNKLPTKDMLTCTKCKGPMSFLCQLYAPGEDEHNFHRTYYTFICRQQQCQESNNANNLLVLRSQLKRANDFYSSEPPLEDGEPLLEIKSKLSTCLACGCHAPMSCARCHYAKYCSATHQRAHWPYHKKDCTQDADDMTKNSSNTYRIHGVVFSEMEIAIEPYNADDDDSSSEEDGEDSERKNVEYYKKLVAEGKSGTLNNVSEEELNKYTEATKADDKVFDNFLKEIKYSSDQVVRFNRGGTPLWITDVQKTIAEQLNIPACENCGGKREFAFQIMPQMLNKLKDESIDWGILAIYVCANSCNPTPDGPAYLKEYIIKQDVVD